MGSSGVSSSSLLRVGFFATASNFATGESGGSAVVLVLVVSDDASVNNSASDVAGEGGGRGRLEVKVGLTNFISSEGED